MLPVQHTRESTSLLHTGSIHHCYTRGAYTTVTHREQGVHAEVRAGSREYTPRYTTREDNTLRYTTREDNTLRYTHREASIPTVVHLREASIPTVVHLWEAREPYIPQGG